MAMGAIVRDRFLESFELYDELAREVPEATLAMKLPGIPSMARSDSSPRSLLLQHPSS